MSHKPFLHTEAIMVFSATQSEKDAYHARNGFAVISPDNIDTRSIIALKNGGHSLSLRHYSYSMIMNSGIVEENLKRYSITPLGRTFCYYVENGYCWNARDKHPMIDYTAGYYDHVLKQEAKHGTANNWHRVHSLAERFRTHYATFKDSVDIYIAEAILKS